MQTATEHYCLHLHITLTAVYIAMMNQNPVNCEAKLMMPNWLIHTRQQNHGIKIKLLQIFYITMET